MFIISLKHIQHLFNKFSASLQKNFSISLKNSSACIVYLRYAIWSPIHSSIYQDGSRSSNPFMYLDISLVIYLPEISEIRNIYLSIWLFPCLSIYLLCLSIYLFLYESESFHQFTLPPIHPSILPASFNCLSIQNLFYFSIYSYYISIYL